MEVKRINAFKVVSRIVAFVVGAFLLVLFYNFYNVGSREDIGLQSPVSAITAADLKAAQNGQLDQIDNNGITDNVNILTYSDVRPRTKSDMLGLEQNTYSIVSEINESGVEDELIAITEFTYDGNPFWVSNSIVNLRQEPTVNSEILSVLEYGQRLIRISYGSLWSYVRIEDGTEGYILTELITGEEIVPDTPTPTPPPTATPVPVANNTNTPTPVPQSIETTASSSSTYNVTDYSATLYASCSLNVRSGPGTEYSMVTVLNTGDAISITGRTDNGWYRTISGYFVKASLCSENAPTPTPVPDSNSGGGSTGGGFASYCRQFLGTVYVYAGMSPSGFDCSGLVSYCYANYYGITLPHNADEISHLGYAVSGDSVQCGDVLCHDYNGDGYVDHVSMYMGDGTCIHASNSRQGVITSAYPMGSVVTIRRFI